MDQPPFRNFVLYGENYYNFSLSAMVDQALAAAVARRTTSLARRCACHVAPPQPACLPACLARPSLRCASLASMLRRVFCSRRLEQDGLPAEWAQSEMLEGYRARGEISLSAALARAHRRQELSQQ
jgi:hypothetical protein